MTTISVVPILRSANALRPDHVLSTFLMTYPRWIHAEGRTHRLLTIDEGEELMWMPKTPSLMADPNLSRNASSSRAIPVRKMIDDVRANPAIPLFWGKNQRGMQAKEDLPPDLAERARNIWLHALEAAIAHAEALAYLAEIDGDPIGVHKQVINRLLEPFSHIRVLVSGTQWSNFIGLRDHADAEPHIQLLARLTRKELEREDNIQILQPGEWHLPFVDQNKKLEITSWLGANFKPVEFAQEYFIKQSVACCASTSYKTVDGFEMTVDRAVSLHDKLVGSQPLHASPAEHVAMADDWWEIHRKWRFASQHGNFRGFRQYRKMLPGECL